MMSLDSLDGPGCVQYSTVSSSANSLMIEQSEDLRSERQQARHSIMTTSIVNPDDTHQSVELNQQPNHSNDNEDVKFKLQPRNHFQSINYFDTCLYKKPSSRINHCSSTSQRSIKLPGYKYRFTFKRDVQCTHGHQSLPSPVVERVVHQKRRMNDPAEQLKSPNQANERFQRYQDNNNQQHQTQSTVIIGRVDCQNESKSAMRERLFQLLSKVPIHVETVPEFRTKILVDKFSSNYNEEEKSPNCVTNLRDSLIIKYYHEQTMTDLIDLHFACSLSEHNQTTEWDNRIPDFRASNREDKHQLKQNYVTNEGASGEQMDQNNLPMSSQDQQENSGLGGGHLELNETHLNQHQHNQAATFIHQEENFGWNIEQEASRVPTALIEIPDGRGPQTEPILVSSSLLEPKQSAMQQNNCLKQPGFIPGKTDKNSGSADTGDKFLADRAVHQPASRRNRRRQQQQTDQLVCNQILDSSFCKVDAGTTLTTDIRRPRQHEYDPGAPSSFGALHLQAGACQQHFEIMPTAETSGQLQLQHQQPFHHHQSHMQVSLPNHDQFFDFNSAPVQANYQAPDDQQQQHHQLSFAPVVNTIFCSDNQQDLAQTTVGNNSFFHYEPNNQSVAYGGVAVGPLSDGANATTLQQQRYVGSSELQTTPWTSEQQQFFSNQSPNVGSLYTVEPSSHFEHHLNQHHHLDNNHPMALEHAAPYHMIEVVSNHERSPMVPSDGPFSVTPAYSSPLSHQVAHVGGNYTNLDCATPSAPTTTASADHKSACNGVSDHVNPFRPAQSDNQQQQQQPHQHRLHHNDPAGQGSLSAPGGSVNQMFECR